MSDITDIDGNQSTVLSAVFCKKLLTINLNFLLSGSGYTCCRVGGFFLFFA